MMESRCSRFQTWFRADHTRTIAAVTKPLFMRIRLSQAFIVFGLCFTTIAAQNTPAGQQLPLLGFDRDGSARERAIEKQFDGFIKKDDLRDWMKRLSARPHHLGSAYDKDNAEFMAG